MPLYSTYWQKSNRKKNPDLWITQMLHFQTQLALQRSGYLWISVYICQHKEWDSSQWQEKQSKIVEKNIRCSVRINYLQIGERELPKREKIENRLDPLGGLTALCHHSSTRKTSYGRRIPEQHKATAGSPHFVPHHSSGWRTRVGERGPAAESCLLSTLQTAPLGPAPRGERWGEQHRLWQLLASGGWWKVASGKEWIKAPLSPFLQPSADNSSDGWNKLAHEDLVGKDWYNNQAHNGQMNITISPFNIKY